MMIKGNKSAVLNGWNRFISTLWSMIVSNEWFGNAGLIASSLTGYFACISAHVVVESTRGVEGLQFDGWRRGFRIKKGGLERIKLDRLRGEAADAPYDTVNGNGIQL